MAQVYLQGTRVMAGIDVQIKMHVQMNYLQTNLTDLNSTIPLNLRPNRITVCILNDTDRSTAPNVYPTTAGDGKPKEYWWVEERSRWEVKTADMSEQQKEVIFINGLPATGVTNTIYVDTSTNTVWYWDGTKWIQIGGTKETSIFQHVENIAFVEEANGARTIFTLDTGYNYVLGSTAVYYNGQRLVLGLDYIELGSKQIEILDSRYTPIVGDSLKADFEIIVFIQAGGTGLPEGSETGQTIIWNNETKTWEIGFPVGSGGAVPLATYIYGTMNNSEAIQLGFIRCDGSPVYNKADYPDLLPLIQGTPNYVELSPTQFSFQDVRDDKTYIKAKRITSGGDAGETETDFVYMSHNTPVVGQNVGGYNDGDVILEGTSLSTVFDKLFTKEIPPIYTSPTIVLAGTGSGIIEAGTNITPVLTPTWTKNDAGNATAYTLRKDGTQIYSNTVPATYTSPQFQIIDDTNNFQCTVNYAEGAIKNTNIGNPYPQGHILAGLINSINIAYTGGRYLFYNSDTGTTPITTSTDIRALSGKIMNPINGTTFNINVVAGQQRLQFAYKGTIRDVLSVVYVEQGNADYTDRFVKTLINVEGANAYSPLEYKYFYYIPAIPFNANVTFKVTI